ncbi:hypothetical protein DCAR_0312720 [Daucus carota subsp. sativus]|uniref:Uncharacterized protein n=1 Tax=Daucus carota subsp. sativus TaxID=79200 RepID=A0AAF1AUX7_DAUCS|nr:PREDICTED: uncharacterized protein LOC108214934 isoform X2 [Daucus carota subsp. sativus]WOG93436.1 hypothetical protein DCAR_0312720 [Daucus carota subsp. sativus]
MLNNVDMMNGDVATLIATTDSVTSVVAAKEEVKQAVGDDLNSKSSIPCEWSLSRWLHGRLTYSLPVKFENAFLRWTYNPTSHTADIAFPHGGVSASKWVACGDLIWMDLE